MERIRFGTVEKHDGVGGHADRRLNLRSSKGTTLAEVLVASAFSLFLTASVFSFANFLSFAKHDYQTNLELTNDARIVLEKMVWGASLAGQVNRRGIAEARTGTIVSATQFSYTDINNVVHTLRLNNGVIEYQRGTGAAWTALLDPNGAAANDPTRYTTRLSFIQPATANSVQVRVVVGKKFATAGRWYYGSASTQVFYRNA